MAPTTRRRAARSNAATASTESCTTEASIVFQLENVAEEETHSRSRQRRQFADLHEEMELAVTGVSETGHARRKLTRHQSKTRTKKRRALERQEIDYLDQGANEKKIRGSKIATEAAVLLGSLVFGGRRAEETEEDTAINGDEDQSGEDGDASDTEAEGDDDDGEGGEDDDDDGKGGGDGDDGEDAELLENVDAEQSESEPEQPKRIGRKRGPYKKKAKPGKAGRSDNVTRPTQRRRVRRLRNFRTAKLAAQHGDALGAHARGKPAVAIRKLKQVANREPCAPQIYSSLGMVYEDMLQDYQRQRSPVVLGQVSGSDNEHGETREGLLDRVSVSFADAKNGSEITDHSSMMNQISLAKKAYGSYHVAAILCKRDYSLWLRAADSASQIASLHSQIVQQPNLAEATIKFHAEEKERWLLESKNDYQTADNLNPPGIDIPAKLAQKLIELGMLSEALTLLTDLKNHPDFKRSYRAWLLFADLQLRIGHECMQWNHGVQTVKNYMFRRWLRKLSQNFDWQERRLQGLVKALETAGGTRNFNKLLQWLRKRISLLKTDLDEACNPVDDEDRKKDADGIATEADCFVDVAITNKPDFKDTKKNASEHDRHILLTNKTRELCSFDMMTVDMRPANNSDAMKLGDEARDSLVVQKQNNEVVTLAGEFHRQEAFCVASVGAHQWEDNIDDEFPPSASCRTVFSIGSQLVRHMIGMELFEGGRLALECISTYLRQRISSRDERKAAEEKYNQAQKEPISVFAMQQEVYDSTKGPGSDEESDDDVTTRLSDDEAFDSCKDESMVAPLRKGVLPPELRFLYGVCLAGEGGKVFLASKCLEAIMELPLDDSSSLTNADVDANISTDSVWLVYKETMTAAFTKISASIFVADTLRKSGREADLYQKLSWLFQQTISDLRTTGIVDQVLTSQIQNGTVSGNRQDKVVTILMAAIRYEIGKLESFCAGTSNVDEQELGIRPRWLTFSQSFGK
jgi:hypothetical protein